MNSILYKEAMATLKERPHNITYADIEHRTGLKASWIRAFASGVIKKPSSHKLETLLSFFGKNINVS